MEIKRAIDLLREDIALYETDTCKPGDGTPDGELMEALQMGIDALEKQSPKKPLHQRLADGKMGDNGVKQGLCPVCAETVIGNWFGEYCGYCGQKLDWEEENE